ncbi:MAG: hypothetical protein ACJ0GY_00760 [Synechococcus sp.]
MQQQQQLGQCSQQKPSKTHLKESWPDALSQVKSFRLFISIDSPKKLQSYKPTKEDLQGMPLVWLMPAE